MATKLYETLGITKDVTMDEVRKAYKKKALQTHPDRLPQGATPDDKRESEEKFRLVNNAYEILSDPQKRKTYDKYGVFPPPEPEQARSHTDFDRRRHHAHFFNDPFVSTGFSTFVFTDPFALFDEIFGQEFPEWRERRSRAHGPSPFMGMDPFFSPFSNSFGGSPMGLGGLFSMMERESFGMHNAFPSHPPLYSHSFPTFEPPSRDRREGRFMQESYMTQTLNGVTQTIHRRIDFDGNEHITRTYPDGRKIHTINGIEQPVHGYLPNPEVKDTRNNSRRLLLPSRHDVRPSSSSHVPQAAPQPHPIHVARSDYSVTAPPPPYPGTSYNTSPPVDHIYRDRDHRRHYERPPADNGYDVYPDANRRMYDNDNHHQDNHRRRRWPGHW